MQTYQNTGLSAPVPMHPVARLTQIRSTLQGALARNQDPAISYQQVQSDLTQIKADLAQYSSNDPLIAGLLDTMAAVSATAAALHARLIGEKPEVKDEDLSSPSGDPAVAVTPAGPGSVQAPADGEAPRQD